MSIGKTVRRQRDFSAGQVDPAAERRSDLPIYQAGLKTARNVRDNGTGAATRRPGRRTLYFGGGRHDIIRPTAGVLFDVTFDSGVFVARLVGGGVVSALSAPWTAEMVPDLRWEAFGRRIFVCHEAMQPQVVEFDEATGQWSLYAYSFREGFGGTIRAPFFRFANYGETMVPSALTGTVILDTSADVFEAGHVGVLFTYATKQVRIATVVNAHRATATVIEELPPTWRVELDSVEGFSLGEVVEGDTTGSTGEVAEINTGSKYLYLVVINQYSGWEVNEYIIGKNGRGKVVSATKAGIDPRPSLRWEEQFMSDVRGWPRAVSTDVQRLIFNDFPQFSQAIVWSAPSAPDDLFVTGAADGAIFEYVPEACRVLHVVGGADEFVLTDIGTFYIPVSEANPLIAGSVRFRPISADGAAGARPARVADGLVFVGSSARKLLAIIATGQTAKPYLVRSITDFHAPLFPSPVELAVSDGTTTVPGTHLYCRNEDGTVAVARYVDGADWIGWFQWTSAGAVTSVVSRYGYLRFAVEYDGGVKTVEAEDDTMLLDGTIILTPIQTSPAITTYDDGALLTTDDEPLTLAANSLLPLAADPLLTTDGAPLTTYDDLEPIVTDAGAFAKYGQVELYAIADGFIIGPVTVDANGYIELDPGFAQYQIGWTFVPEIEPFLPAPEGGDSYKQALRRRKVSKVAVTVRGTQTFVADGREFAGWKVGDNQETPRVPRDDTYSYRTLGRIWDPTIEISQPIPGALTVIEIAAEVTS